MSTNILPHPKCKKKKHRQNSGESDYKISADQIKKISKSRVLFKSRYNLEHTL